MGFKQLAAVRLCSFAVLTVVCLGVMQAAAQEQQISPATQPGAATDSATTSNNAEILAELARMRARIQELESQLKAQSAATPVDPSPAKQFSSSSEAQPVAVHVGGRQEQGKTEKPKPAEPF